MRDPPVPETALIHHNDGRRSRGGFRLPLDADARIGSDDLATAE
jgi:hypothetical protein